MGGFTKVAGRLQRVPHVDGISAPIQNPQRVKQTEQVGRWLVNDHHNQAPLGGLRLQESHHNVRIGRGKARGGFIHKQNGRLADQLQRDVEPLALAPADGFGQRPAHLEIGGLLLLKLLEHLPDPFAPLTGRKPRQAKPGVVVQIFADRQILKQQIVLRHISDEPLQFVRMGIEIPSVEAHLPGLGSKTSVQEIDERGLSHPATPHDANQASAGFTEGKSVNAPLAARKTVRHLIGFKQDGCLWRRRRKQALHLAEIHRIPAGIPQNGS